jgi:hypothetical protein
VISQKRTPQDAQVRVSEDCGEGVVLDGRDKQQLPHNKQQQKDKNNTPTETSLHFTSQAVKGSTMAMEERNEAER